MIERIAEFLQECPAFEDAELNINFLDGMAPAYALEYCPVVPKVKTYTDGGTVCEKRFILAVRAENSQALCRNSAVARKCEMIEEWIMSRADQGLLPQIGDGCVPLVFEVEKSFGIVQTASVDVRFEAVLKLLYYM